MTQQSLAPILVTGGTGRTGGRQARRLLDRRIPGIGGSRREGAPFYWHDSGTWPRALDGASAAYLC
ncbi:NmrA family transcriptional regulator, partial [Arthrobacter sp. CC3]